MQVPIGKGRQKSHIIISVLMTHLFFESLFGLVFVQSPPRAETYVLGVLLHVEDLHNMTSHVLTLPVYLCCLALLFQKSLKLRFFVCDNYIQILARYYYTRTAYLRIFNSISIMHTTLRHLQPHHQTRPPQFQRFLSLFLCP